VAQASPNQTKSTPKATQTNTNPTQNPCKLDLIGTGLATELAQTRPNQAQPG